MGFYAKGSLLLIKVSLLKSSKIVRVITEKTAFLTKERDGITNQIYETFINAFIILTNIQMTQ